MAKKDKEPVDLWAIQREIQAQRGKILICGVDEAGRGPLAGPVCAAAVILPDGYEIPGLNDSKQLTDKKRRELFPVIKEQAIAYGISMVDEKTIDEINILNATFLAMKNAIAQLSVTPELALIERVREEKIPTILCINKTDTVKPDALLPVIAAYHEAWDGFAAIIPISAHTGDGLDELTAEMGKYAQEGPQLFPDGQTSDQPERQVMGEILREKLLLCLDKEIPHGTAVELTKFSERDDEVIEIDATIYCEKASHKGIIIGKQGAMLKKISSLARQDMEKFMGTRVYLQTWVKVKENWRDNVNYVHSLGYRDD